MSTQKKINPTLAAQCKLCKLLQTHPDLWTEIHEQVLVQGMSKAQVARWLNSRVKILNIDLEDSEKLPTFSDQNFSRHFSQHITEYDKMNLKLKGTAITAPGGNTFKDEDFAVATEFLQDYQQDLTEYTYLSKMVDVLDTRISSYHKYMQKYDREHPDRKPNLTELKDVMDMSKSLMDMKLKLATLRNSAKVAGFAVESAVSHTVDIFLEKLFSVTEESQAFMMAELPGSSIPVEGIKIIRENIRDGMVENATAIVNEVRREYNIK